MTTPQRRYTVISLAEATVPTEDGRFRRVTAVRFRLANGHDSTLEIPEVNLTPQRAKELLDREADRLEAIYQLG